ncbi:isochorismatase family cysteine hydrolase [Bacillus gobiensis]|uniref:isochorismatase family cysteine hydrolase n=1 Tax=Bacillus gobiensis TaxID=1441095 RepID=UPI003D19431D
MAQSNTALIIIDMINDFDFDMGELLSEKTRKMVPNLLRVKEHARKMKWPIIYINDHYDTWQADLSTILSACKNEKSQEIIDQIAPDGDDYFLIKPKHSAFYGTALETLLNKLGAEKLILTGIAGNICVLFTANDAYMREYKLIIPRDCMVSNNDKDNEYTLTVMENVLLAEITSSKDLAGDS